MLRLLEQHSDLEEIEHYLNNLVIGESRKLLIPAYSKFKLADSVYQREKQLHQKGISSEYIPPSFIVFEALMPCFKHKLKSSGP